MQRIYDEISKLQTEQLTLERKVSKLELRAEEIDLSAQTMMTDFYKRYCSCHTVEKCKAQ